MRGRSGVRSGGSGESFALEQYVNDRPYVASSFLSAALSKAFGTAMNGTCKDKPDLPNEALPLANVFSFALSATVR